MSKTMVEQVCAVNLCIFHSRPLQNQQRKRVTNYSLILSQNFSVNL